MLLRLFLILALLAIHGAWAQLPMPGGSASAAGGVQPLSRGGTGQQTWVAGRCVQVDSTGSALESAAAACGSGGSETIAGDGLVNTAGTFSVDSAVIPFFSSSTADPTGNCAIGRIHHRTDTSDIWHCPTTNTWVKIAKPDANMVTAAGTLTENAPLIGGGGKAAAAATPSGNTTTFGTTSGTLTPGKQLTPDANGNIVASDYDVGSGGGGLTATKYTVGYASLTDADTQQDVDLFELPAKGKIVGITIKHATAFTAPDLESLAVKIGWSGDAGFYSPPFKIHTPVRTGNLSCASNVCTLNTVDVHNLITGDWVTISGEETETDLNGSYTVTYSDTDTVTFATSNVTDGDYTPSVTTVADQNMWDDGGWVSASAAAHNIVARFDSTGDNLADLTAGSLEVWIATTTLP